MKSKVLYLMFFAILFFIASCGGSGSGDSPTPADENVIAKAMPSDVVVSSPTADLTGSAMLSVKSVIKVEETEDLGPMDFVSKKKEIDSLLAGTGECSFEIKVFEPQQPFCYGPSIDYQNHPDGPPTPDHMLPGSDVGLWNETELGKEACSAAQMNYLVNDVASRADNAVKIVSAMACAGKKDDKELPEEVDAEENFKDSMADNITAPGLTIINATMERLANDAEGNKVYLSTIDFKVDKGDVSINGKVVLKHIPLDEENKTYKGKIAILIERPEIDSCGGSSGNPPQELSGPGVNAGTIIYNKTDDLVIYKYNFADFCGEETNPFDANLDIDPNDKYDEASNPNGWSHDWHYGLFNINPNTGLGTVAYAWQAGARDYRSRTFNITVSDNTDNSASGIAFYGFGPDVTESTLGLINGFICNWAGPNGAISVGPNKEDREQAFLVEEGKAVNKAQKQIIERPAGEAVFTTTAEDSYIKYAPDNACSIAGDDFTYFAEDKGSGQTFSNDHKTVSDVESELIDILDPTKYDFEMPIEPTL